MTLKPPLPINQGVNSNRKNPSVSMPISPAARALKDLNSGILQAHHNKAVQNSSYLSAQSQPHYQHITQPPSTSIPGTANSSSTSSGGSKIQSGNGVIHSNTEGHAGIINYLQSAPPAGVPDKGKQRKVNQLMITSLQQPIVLISNSSTSKKDQQQLLGNHAGNLPNIAGRRLNQM